MSQMSGDSNRPDLPATSQDASPPTADLLRKVLESTLLRGSTGITDSELEALQNIASQSRSQPLPLDQVANLLVLKFLEIRFGSNNSKQNTSGEKKTGFETMAKSIAETLCNDPTSSKRLAEFWDLLQKSAP